MFFFNLISDTRLKYFGQLIENFKKKSKIHVLGIETDPDWPDLDRHGMDADPDPDQEKIMRIRTDLGIRIHNTGIYEHSASLHLIFLKFTTF
jgi:hypothetical protein